MTEQQLAMSRGDAIARVAVLEAEVAELRKRVCVPDVSAMARVLSDRSADACNIDRTDNWAIYGQEYIGDVRAMLAAPAPVERVEQDHDAIALDKARNIMQIMYGEMPKGGSAQLLAMVQVCVLEAMSHVCTPQHAPTAVPLAAKHQGMCISAQGLLARVRGRLQFGAREMLKHLEEMADRYYAGDISVVDEFLQLYCLDEKRPEQQTEGAQR